MKAWSLLERKSPKDVGSLAHTECVDVRLLTDAGPGSMDSAVQPETRLVAIPHPAWASAGFFLLMEAFLESTSLASLHPHARAVCAVAAERIPARATARVRGDCGTERRIVAR